MSARTDAAEKLNGAEANLELAMERWLEADDALNELDAIIEKHEARLRSARDVALKATVAADRVAAAAEIDAIEAERAKIDGHRIRCEHGTAKQQLELRRQEHADARTRFERAVNTSDESTAS